VLVCVGDNEQSDAAAPEPVRVSLIYYFIISLINLRNLN